MLEHVMAAIRSRRRAAALAGAFLLAVLAAVAWLATIDDVRVWPARNTLQYRALAWWWARAGEPQGAPNGVSGTLRGTVRDTHGSPIAGAQVLVSRWDGTTYGARTGAGGAYRIDAVPVGTYVPVAVAPGYDDTTTASAARGGALPWSWSGVAVRPATESVADIVLARPPEQSLGAVRAAAVGEPARVACEQPLVAEAVRRAVTFDHGRHTQRALAYLPVDAAAAAPADGREATHLPSDGRRPLLLTVYPGPANEWECASVPLAAAGYAVLAVGPDYTFDLERDVDDLDRLLAYARTEAGAGALPGADGNRVAVLGGSYSSLHVQRLLQRDRHAGHVSAVLLLGPITDLFDVRRRLEDRTFVPPFGLDQALVALGLPDREPLRYWRYSSAYHVRRDFPPIGLIHSRADDAVPVEQSQLLARELQGAGVPFELHVLTGGGHYLLSEADEARAVYDLTLDFLARHLPRQAFASRLSPRWAGLRPVSGGRTSGSGCGW
jgi:hypothetical protein